MTDARESVWTWGILVHLARTGLTRMHPLSALAVILREIVAVDELLAFVDRCRRPPVVLFIADEAAAYAEFELACVGALFAFVQRCRKPLTVYALAREAANRAARYADEGCIENGWEIGGGLWEDEASDHLYDERETLGAEVYALARALLAERELDA